MTLNDLTEVQYKFTLDFEGDAVDHWDYRFCANWRHEKLSIGLSQMQLEQLRDNCKAILKATKS